MDGWITVGTKIDTKDLGKELKNAEKKFKGFSDDTERLTKKKIKLEVDTKNSEKNIEILNNKIEQSYQKLQREKEKLASIPTWKQEGSEYQKQIEAVSKTQISYDTLLSKHELAVDKINRQEKELQNINNTIKENTNQQSILNDEIDEMRSKLNNIKSFENIKNDINNVNNSMSGVLKKVAKWGLAIFSVRSAYMFVRQAVSTVSQYNSKISSDIEYIRYALASTLTPVIKGIINLVRTLLTYINYIWKAWTGKDLFASAKAFENAKKSTSGMAKDTKEIKKNLTASFDEMEVLQEQSDTSSSGGGGIEANIPSFDLTDSDIPIPWWVDWIAKNKDTITTIAATIGGLFAASTVSKWLGNIGKLFGSSGGTGLVGLLGKLKNIALIGGGIVITGYVAASFLQDLEDLHSEIHSINAAADKYLDDRTRQIEDIDVLIDTANVRMTSGNEILKNNESIFGKITGLSKDQLETIKNVVEHSEATLDQEIKIYKQGKLTQKQKEKLLKSLRSQIEYNDDAIEYLEQQGIDTTELVKINDKYKENWALISDEVLNNIDNLSTIEELNAKTNDRIAASNDLFKISNSWLFKNSEFYKQNLEDAKKTVTENEKIADKEMEIYKNTKLNSDEKKKILANLQTQITYNQSVIDKLKEQGKDTSEIEKINNKLKGNWEGINNELTGTKTKFDDINNTKLNDKDLKINVTADNTGAKKSLLSIFDSLKEKFKKTFGKLFGFSTGGIIFSNNGIGFAKGGISVPKPIRCARGSIISQPGRGVPITRAVAGEGGTSGSREGIIPLTDSQMMSQLGEAIGKYITVNLTNTIKLDNRQIAKEQKIINARNDFAVNR